MVFEIYTGREKVIMPISYNDFQNDIVGSIKKHLSTAISIHKKNASEMDKLHKCYLGKQNIEEKKRYDDSKINNIVVENHTFRQVNFKVGFMYGNALEYTITNEKKVDCDDLTYLNAYLSDVNKPSLDIEKAQDLYEYGIAYQRLIPKRTPIDDVNSESPFELEAMPAEKTCVVYSNDIPSVALFGLVISSVSTDGGLSYQDCYHIYLPNRKLEVASVSNTIIKDIAQPYNYIPIHEFCLNKDRMGIVELNLLLNNLVNLIDSSNADEIEENVNSFLVMYNQRIDDDYLELFKKLKAQRVIALNTNDPNKPADIKKLENKVVLDASNIFYERVLKASYDIVAVPQASGNVTSGGDTGAARLLGNGWESAQNQAQVDQTYLTQFERHLLRNILWICKNTANCPIDEINVSDITIKFNINMSNNLLVKAEAMQLLDSIGLPEKANLTLCGITNDVDGLGDSWKKNKNEISKRENSGHSSSEGVNSNNTLKKVLSE